MLSNNDMNIFPVKVDVLDKNFDVFSRIVRGITHDYNNLLTPILAYPEIIKMDIKEGTNGLSLMSSIETAAQELLNINRQLMYIISSESSDTIDTDVYDLMDSLKRSIDGVADFEGIKLDITCKKGMVIQCQYNDILTALQKVVHNAWDAVDNKGSVKIVAEKTKLPTQDGHAQSGRDGKPYVCISIIDRGVGIDTRHMNCIFEPFFTTKKSPSKRTVGLGLTLAYRLIINSGGLVGVESVAGQGVTMRIYLPAVG